MADLEKHLPLNQSKAWEPQNVLHNPIPNRTGGFRLPDTMRLEHVVAEGQRRQYADIVPDQAIHGIEWAMYHTIPRFLNRIMEQWNIKISADNGRIAFRYLSDCVTGRAGTI